MSAPHGLETLLRGVEKTVSLEELEGKLKKKRALRVKLGVDPTSPDLHLGHTVALGKLRQFQDQGHTVVFIIGDSTATIGDPSGRSETRPVLAMEQVKANAQTYLAQVFKILDENKTEVRWNSEWLRPLLENAGKPGESIVTLMSQHTVQQLLEREDFKTRLAEGKPITLLEILYPLMQGYDSVMVKADVEIGGTDQLFNLLMGRRLQKERGQEPQVVLTLPLLEGTDGVRKMSKSYGNAIALNDAPKDMFGKTMAIPDELMWKFYELLTEDDLESVKALHPMEAKYNLAEKITARYHGADAARREREEFQRRFSQRETPRDVAPHKPSKLPIRLTELIVELRFAPSKNEAHRLIKQGAVEKNGARVAADEVIEKASGDALYKVGKKNLFKI